MRLPYTLTIGAAFLLLTTTDAEAQDSRGYVAFKGGLNSERAEDNLRGSSVGGGVVAGLHFSDAWALEGEFWLPGYIRTNPEGGRHRDTLLGVSMRRSFGNRVRPHVLFGLSAGRTEDGFTTCGAIRSSPSSTTPVPVRVSCTEPDVTERHQERFSSISLFPLVGAGVEIPLGARVRLIPDVRVQLGIGSVIVRPAVALGFSF
jgi:hypothetical protein